MKQLWMVVLIVLNLFGVSAQMQKNVFVSETGGLRSKFTEDEAKNVTHLSLSGRLNALDFKVLRDEFDKLQFLDLTNADIKLYVGKEGTYPEGKRYVYPMSCIPAYAFKGKKSLKQIVLPAKLANVEDAAFLGCESLRIVQMKKKKPSNLLPQALSDSLTTVFVPLGCRDSYWRKSQWKDFNLLEGEPITVFVTVNEPGTLEDEIRKTGYRLDQVNVLSITGSLDLEDFKNIRDNMPYLVSVDLTGIDNGLIPEFTFSQKRYLMFIDFPKTLEEIGQRAFSGCIHLCGVLTLPEGMQYLGDSTFLGCDRLQAVMMNGKNVK